MSTWTSHRTRNPLGLTDRQAEAVALLVQHGGDKPVAAAMGITKTAAARLLVAAQRAAQVSTRVQLALAWDRLHRSGRVHTGGQP